MALVMATAVSFLVRGEQTGWCRGSGAARVVVEAGASQSQGPSCFSARGVYLGTAVFGVEGGKEVLFSPPVVCHLTVKPRP